MKAIIGGRLRITRRLLIMLMLRRRGVLLRDRLARFVRDRRRLRRYGRRRSGLLWA
jgi:hypothetical protein